MTLTACPNEYVMPVAPSLPILIAGPTASGKSAVAVEIAARLGGIVINADSMQVYRELRVLTARPGPSDEARAPHLLYGHVSATESYSVARWLEDVRCALAEATVKGLRPIVVGGTGLYFKALLEGLSPVPEIPAAIRRHWRAEAQRLTGPELHEQLHRRDPTMAARLAPADRQRTTRALEVFDATGRSLSEWHRESGTPLLVEAETKRLVIDRARSELQVRTDMRFDRMMQDGAIDEVRELLRLALPPEAPAMRALGVRPIADLLAGRATLQEAAERTRSETRQYIKRQQTWLKRHMMSWKHAKMTDNSNSYWEIVAIID